MPKPRHALVFKLSSDGGGECLQTYPLRGRFCYDRSHESFVLVNNTGRTVNQVSLRLTKGFEGAEVSYDDVIANPSTNVEVDLPNGEARIYTFKSNVGEQIAKRGTFSDRTNPKYVIIIEVNHPKEPGCADLSHTYLHVERN